MDEKLRSRLYTAVVECRRILEDDLADQLESLYSVRRDGGMTPAGELAHLDAVGQDDRATIEAALAHFGGEPAAAVERYLRESAFTWLNRLAALKLMEHPSRALIQPSIGAGAQSKGFTTFALLSPAAMRGEPDGGYRLYLELLADDLALELDALFNRRLPTSLLFPSEPKLKAVLERLNAPELEPAWGQDETVGWVYQYFTPTELRQKVRKESAAPRDSYELSFRNQFYTPRYVVAFLAENTLGRLWYEMRRGQTALAGSCRYLIRRKHPIFLEPGQEPPQPYDGRRDGWSDPDLAGEMWVRPNPEISDVSTIFRYALTVGGYDYAHKTWGLHPSEIWKRASERHRETGQWEGSFEELRVALFFTQRGYHHDGYGPEGNEIESIRALHRAICRQWEIEVELIRPPEPRDPRALRILDPACGSGHFLLYCFDLLETIYAEAYETSEALRTDYPDRAAFDRAVPGLILGRNLHGIDIDRRAAQIARLALWLRAQRSYKALGLKIRERPRPPQAQVVCAEPMPGEADLLAEFAAGLQPAALGYMLPDIWAAMRGAGELGSLLRIEDATRRAAAETRRKIEALPEAHQPTLFSAGRPRQAPLPLRRADLEEEAFWTEAVERLRAALRDYVAHTAGRDVRRQLFTSDAGQGIDFLDLLHEPFDVVLMNPPFGAPTPGSKAYLERHYPRTKNDLYAAFVERGLELLRPGGYLGAITSRTGFFLTSFQKWREEILLREAEFVAMADLGYGVLDTAMVETAAYVVKRVGARRRALSDEWALADER